VLDNFHFGLDAARNATDSQGVLMGMEMVLKQFQDFLQNQNITPVPADPGSVFDPNLHEAVAQEHDPEVPDGAILKVIRSGYRMGERLVRASNVVVSKGPKA
jgi:molecular chaperone GrpE